MSLLCFFLFCYLDFHQTVTVTRVRSSYEFFDFFLRFFFFDLIAAAESEFSDKALKSRSTFYRRENRIVEKGYRSKGCILSVHSVTEISHDVSRKVSTRRIDPINWNEQRNRDRIDFLLFIPMTISFNNPFKSFEIYPVIQFDRNYLKRRRVR